MWCMSSVAGSDRPILRAKLLRPQVTKDLIARPRLLASLDAGLNMPLTVVVAPAGFGKTTLVSSWISELEAGTRPGISLVPSIWLSLDEVDSDLGVFLHLFVSALRTVFPDAAPRTRMLLDAQQLPSVADLAHALNNDIEVLPSSFIMVLDDAHLLRGQAVFDILSIWMPHWPHNMHLILLSRLNPPLSLTKYRVSGTVNEIRSRDLRFNEAETNEYLQQVLGSSVMEPEPAAVYKKLEGWIGGVKLATLASKARENYPELPSAVLTGDVSIGDYLIDEVLLQQPMAIQRFLLKISILDQFCASLCEALLADEEPDCDIQQCLEYLLVHELFVSALDSRREWYRMREVFRELLQDRMRQRLGDQVVDVLHCRAAQWYAAQGFVDRALRHALEGNSHALAIQIMQQGLHDVLNHTDRPTLERWLQLLPADVIAQQPELLIMLASKHGLHWNLEQMVHAALQAETLLDNAGTAADEDDAPRLRGHIAVFKSMDAYFDNRFLNAIALAREALALLPAEWLYVRGIAAIFLSLSLHSTGSHAEAEQFLTAQYEATVNRHDGYALQMLQGMAINALQSGQLDLAQRTAQVMLDQSPETAFPIIRGWAHYLMGHAFYHRNDLEQAEQRFAAIVDLRLRTQMLVVRIGMIGLAYVYQAQGKPVLAMHALDDLSQLDLELHGRESTHVIAARARLLYRQGDFDGAHEWSRQTILPPREQPLLPWLDEPLLTRIAVLVARNRPAEIETAHRALDVLDGIALRTHSTRSRVEILALRALAQMAQGDLVNARQFLIKSLEIARRTGHVQVYIEHGPPMERLLGQIAGHGKVGTTVNNILAAFTVAEEAGAVRIPSAGRLSGDGKTGMVEDSFLQERLTVRELEILRLMAEPVSLAEISEQLDIAHSTAKRHTANLYTKLGVHSRWEAVAAAVELGLLPPR